MKCNLELLSVKIKTKSRKLKIHEIKMKSKIKMRYIQNVKCKLNVIFVRFTAEKIVLAYVRIQH